MCRIIGNYSLPLFDCGRPAFYIKEPPPCRLLDERGRRFECSFRTGVAGPNGVRRGRCAVDDRLACHAHLADGVRARFNPRIWAVGCSAKSVPDKVEKLPCGLLDRPPVELFCRITSARTVADRPFALPGGPSQGRDGLRCRQDR